MSSLLSPDMPPLIVLPSGKSVYAEIHSRTSGGSPDIPIIFIHGFLNTTLTWVPVLPYFTGYTRILYDMEGHGNTPAGDAPITISSLAQDLNDILDYHGYDEAIVVGHSAGTTVAMQFAHQFPRKTELLVLMGPLGLPLPRDEMMANADLIRNMSMEDMVAHVMQWLGRRGKKDPKIRALVRSETERHDKLREGVARHMEAVAQYIFAGVGDVETWVVRGMDDRISHEKAAESVRKLVHGRMIVLETGHYFTWENLDAAVDALDRALGG
ncbi:hypothetical protein EW026_g2187 [Hermanssonia centrifuga]|uniref:AB hydrolase-1 domain-containing protein n=1 Tax=Hermanssonia centrifuga TaxID=98765 RepID=A0A4S4KPU5_9APHY|nr:hypothetical protein EW026_g2187 [Hermanssonia centrifuga]